MKIDHTDPASEVLVVRFRLRPGELERLRDLAREADRSVASFVRVRVREALREDRGGFPELMS